MDRYIVSGVSGGRCGVKDVLQGTIAQVVMTVQSVRLCST